MATALRQQLRGERVAGPGHHLPEGALWHGMISVVFFNYSCASTRTCASSSFAARLFHNAVAEEVRIPLCIKEAPPCLCAADAFAKGKMAGLGGWFLLSGLLCAVRNIRWFRLAVTRDTLPSWLRPAQSEPLQSIIASLEALAQLMLLVLRCRELALPRGEYFILLLPQLCDNAGVVSASSKMLSMKEPLCWILQAVGFWSVKLGVRLSCSKIAGVRNCWSDALSRDGLPGVSPALER